MTSRPALFVGSSTESIRWARALKEDLERDAEVTVWDEDVFKASGSDLQSLIRQLQTSDFAALVFSTDDELKLRGDEFKAARDNVVFELGLAIGELGQYRAFILIPSDTPDLRIPTDLLGISPIRYDAHRSDGNLVAAMGSAANKVRRAMEFHKKRPPKDFVPDKVAPTQLVLQGISQVASKVGIAFGPKGAAVNVSIGSGRTMPTRDGLVIARGSASGDASEEQGINVLQDVALKMRNDLGDYAKTAILLCAHMVGAARGAIENGHSVHGVLAGMEAAVNAADQELALKTTSVANRWRDVVRTASGSGDIADVILQAVEGAGQDGIVVVEEGSTPGMQVELSDGMTFDRGFLSPEFVTDQSRQAAILTDAYLLVWPARIGWMKELLPIMNLVAQTGKPLMVIAEAVEDEALLTLVVNNTKNTLRSVAVRSPGFAERRRDISKDIAIYTGARFVDPLLGDTLAKVTLADLGRAKHVTVDVNTTIIRGGGGSRGDVDARAQALRDMIKSASDGYAKEKLQERLANISGRTARIVVNGRTEADTDELRRRSVAGLRAINQAYDGGVLPGGGVALIHAKRAIASAGREVDAARLAGRKVVSISLEQPLRRLAETIRRDQGEIVRQVEESDFGIGLNVESERIEDLEAAGILDAALSLRSALTNAFLQAKLVLRTEVW